MWREKTHRNEIKRNEAKVQEHGRDSKGAQT